MTLVSDADEKSCDTLDQTYAGYHDEQIIPLFRESATEVSALLFVLTQYPARESLLEVRRRRTKTVGRTMKVIVAPVMRGLSSAATSVPGGIMPAMLQGHQATQ